MFASAIPFILLCVEKGNKDLLWLLSCQNKDNE